eukprot:1018578-Pleurochrysis_carterae.AAC.1
MATLSFLPYTCNRPKRRRARRRTENATSRCMKFKADGSQCSCRERSLQPGTWCGASGCCVHPSHKFESVFHIVQVLLKLQRLCLHPLSLARKPEDAQAAPCVVPSLLLAVALPSAWRSSRRGSCSGTRGT